MSLFNSSTLCKALSGISKGPLFESNRLCIDTRKLQEGDLFWALEGEKHDGHLFLKEAFAKGASGAIISNPDFFVQEGPCILVKDTQKALEAYAHFVRENHHRPILALTGSAGKTTVKEGLAFVLKGQSSVYASIGNFNNHLGLPISLVHLPQEADFGIFELGMNHAKEISSLVKLLKPDITMVINCGYHHIGNFDCFEDLVLAKAEIFEEGRIKIAYCDAPYYEILKTFQKGAQWITFGKSENATVRLLKTQTLGEGLMKVSVGINGQDIEYILPDLGPFWVNNSLAILSGVYALGADVIQAASLLKDFLPLEGRGKKISLASGITVIDDAYNAGPSSMKMALGNLAHAKTPGRKIAILGAMRELGAFSKQQHEALLEFVMPLEGVILCGQEMEDLYNILPLEKKMGFYSSSASLLKDIQKLIQKNDMILIKGSRSVGLDCIVSFLQSNF